MDNKIFNKVSGYGGEQKAVEYLKKKGYKIASFNSLII
jgi:Holliday junction resolvase-like predicted endonuclease